MSLAKNEMPRETAKEEEWLAAQAQAGDRRAFELLLARNYDFLFRAAWRWTGNREDAEDIAQEVAIRLAKAIRGFKGKSSVKTFLYALTLNAVRDQGRKRAQELRKTQAYYVHSLTEPAAAVNNDEDSATSLWAAVRQLPEKQRDAVLLVHAEGLSHAEAGALIGCSEKTVSWHIHEARKRLKLILRAGDDENA